MSRLQSRLASTAGLVVLLAVAGCARPPVSTIGRQPTASELAPFWIEPAADRDLYSGPGGAARAPRPDVVYTLVERKTGGFSPKVDVRDPAGTRWSVKMGDEAQPEVTSSRIVWGVGYHQPFDYYLVHWRMQDGAGVHDMGPGRFRPHLKQLKSLGPWPWHSNPFVSSAPFRGLLVLMMILNSTDLKDDNNEVFELGQPAEGAREWYTVKDLGASLGQTGRIAPKRNDVGLFEKQAFITGHDGRFVRFEFHGRHQELVHALSAADVAWMCRRLSRLSPRQMRDAFRAGGYDEETTQRYIDTIHAKIAQGMASASGESR